MTETLSDQLVDATDAFTTQLAGFDSLPASEIGNRLARVAVDYVIERQARVSGVKSDLADSVELDEDYLDAFYDAFVSSFDNAINTHCRNAQNLAG